MARGQSLVLGLEMILEIARTKIKLVSITVISVILEKRSFSRITRAMREETNSGWSRNWSKSVAFLSMNTETTVGMLQNTQEKNFLHLELTL